MEKQESVNKYINLKKELDKYNNGIFNKIISKISCRCRIEEIENELILITINDFHNGVNEYLYTNYKDYRDIIKRTYENHVKKIERQNKLKYILTSDEETPDNVKRFTNSLLSINENEIDNLNKIYELIQKYNM